MDPSISSLSTNGALRDGRLLGAPISDNQQHEGPPMDIPSSTQDQPITNRLLEAAMSGDSSDMNHMFLKDPEMLHGITSHGATCLHISSILGHEKFSTDVLALNQALSKYLLSKTNSYGETPLVVAVTSGHVSLTSALLKQYQQLQLSEMILKQDNNGDNALHHAIRNGHSNLALELITSEDGLSRGVNKYNESPMYIAVMRGFNDVFKLLWETKMASHKGPFDDNALHAAVRNENIGIIRTIMETYPELARKENKSGRTPVHYAVNRNQTDVIRVILGFDRSLGYLVNSKEGNSLLVSAASRGHIDVAREILKHCPDAPYSNRANLTILHQAVINDRVKFVEFILQNRQLDKVINIRDRDGFTALHHAVKSCNPKIVRALLAHKEIDVRIYDTKGRPAFWQLIETKDSTKSLNWNEVFMLMSKADPQAAPFYREVAMKKVTVKSKEEIKSLTETYTKNTSLVAIFIATITFAAAFTLPGGYSNDSGSEGLPIMARKTALKAFLISDTLAMCSSLAVAFLCILARWEDLVFLNYYRSCTKKLMWFAYMATTIAFATGLYTVAAPSIQWLAILVCVLCIALPFLTKLLGEWPLLKLQLWLLRDFQSDFLDMV
ncbi:Ankyrin repeat-containing protein [Rhynchospora pubera]|uniref:Ankyrin repeat-containing protein n=1 Tax=Rhynchospora pubera TaxID=906938 RepID=A0AAV8C9C1_9POAL|nr:Ankyrin repeat-containing protein [Rhynchospora pubera]